MAIGTTAAILGAAIIGGGAAYLGSKSQAKGISQAADAQNQSAAMQYQLGQESLALNKDIYNSNYGVLSPFVSRGNVAGDALNALLGLPTAPVMTSPLAAPNGGSYSNPSGGLGPASAPYSQAQINAMWNDGIDGNAEAAQRELDAWNAQQAAQPAPAPAPAPTPAPTPATPAPGAPVTPAERPGHAAINANRAERGLPPIGGGIAPATPAAPGTSPAANPAAANPATTAMQNFANSAGMQFQLEQGGNMIEHSAASRGVLQSGAALKALQDYGQQTALNNYFMPYMGLLGNQQAVGAGSASSIAGVGTQFGNTAANINNNMAQTSQNSANALGNLAIQNGANQANLWNNLGSSFGNVLGGIAY